MPFSAFFLILLFLIGTSSTRAEISVEISLSVLNSLEPESPKNTEARTETDAETNAEIDWSKPIVSRGFGLDESLYNIDRATLAQYKSGQTFYFFGEYAKAAEKWQPLLKQNFSEAQASMGWLYQAGLGVKKDEMKAFLLYMKAAKQNNPIAQNNIGVMYENGISVAPDPAKAQQWYKRSAEQGYRFGQFNYANSLLSQPADGVLGLGEMKRIKLFFKKSADQGVLQASEKLKTLGSPNG